MRGLVSGRLPRALCAIALTVCSTACGPLAPNAGPASDGPSAPSGGQRIVFASTRDGNYDLYASKVDGTEVVNLTDRASGDAGFPVYSPDGRRIAFTAAYPEPGLYVMNADGAGQRLLATAGRPGPAPRAGLLESPDWSPDGSRIAFTSLSPGQGTVSVVNADGTGLRPLTGTGVDACDPSWSPDGRRIAYGSCGTSDDDLFVMNADGSKARRLTKTPGVAEFQPTWSPDGRRIAYASARIGAAADLFVMDADGSKPRQLTSDPANDQQAAWSPDGRLIAFASDRADDDVSSVYVMDAAGGRPRNITPEGGDSPSWSPPRTLRHAGLPAD